MEEQTEENISAQFVSKFSLIMSNYISSSDTILLTNLLSEFCADYTITNRCTDLVPYESTIPPWIQEYAAGQSRK